MNVIDTFNALTTAKFSTGQVYEVHGWNDEYGRGKRSIGFASDYETAQHLAKNKGFYCDGSITGVTATLATFPDGEVAIVTISLREVHKTIVSYEDRLKKEIQDRALAKLSKEEREALGL